MGCPEAKSPMRAVTDLKRSKAMSKHAVLFSVKGAPKKDQFTSSDIRGQHMRLSGSTVPACAYSSVFTSRCRSGNILQLEKSTGHGSMKEPVVQVPYLV